MNNVLEKIENNKDVAEMVGYRLIRELRLRNSPDHKGRWSTEGGDKTAMGIARVVARILKDEASDDRKLFQICFTHKHGINMAVISAKEEPSSEAACKALDWDYDSNDANEYVEISSVEIVNI